MCGRFALYTDLEKIKQQFNITSVEPIPKSTNIAPTELALCLIQKESGLHALQMRFGIVPWYQKDKKPSLLLNARVETVAKKSAFKQNLKHRRCLILMSGFFEWKHYEGKKEKQPFYFTRKDHKLMAVAGVWEMFKPTPDIAIPSCVILTTSPNELVAELHDRMPLNLSEEAQSFWLKQISFNEKEITALLQLNHHPILDYYPVTSKLNSPRFKEENALLPMQR